MFDQRALKAAKIAQIVLTANIVLLWSIGIIFGISKEDGWMGMVGVFAFSLYMVIPFFLMFIALSCDTCFKRIENQISKKFGFKLSFMKQPSNQSTVKQIIGMILGTLVSFVILSSIAFLFCFGILFYVSQKNPFWLVVGLFAFLVVSIACITALLTMTVRAHFKQLEKSISECDYRPMQ